MSRVNSSKVSLAESSPNSDNSDSSLSGSDDDDDDYEDDEEEEDDALHGEDYDNYTVAEILAKFGYDYKSLFTVTTKKLDNGSLVKLKPPLILSQFFHVPPCINFVTSEGKRKNF
jgi:hypothetical protein